MEDWELVGFVASSQPRLVVLVHLTKQASGPTAIASQYNIPKSRVSTVLKELMSLGLVKCLTPNLRKGRLYEATDKGREVINKLHELTDLGN